MTGKQRFPRTKKQRNFRTQFWKDTGFQFIDDTTMPFVERAQGQITWFRNMALDATQRLERELAEIEASHD